MRPDDKSLVVREIGSYPAENKPEKLTQQGA